ncbi:hypothetical protein AB0D14_01665 [Streptomyces sp. NPDC048484]|uniref:hypothetical protein n=1 Tax=Streptomyces sp. NPDC048484 TaxID=3155146 RepID=UPI00341853D4
MRNSLGLLLRDRGLLLRHRASADVTRLVRASGAGAYPVPDGRGGQAPLANGATPWDGVLHSTISEPDGTASGRTPAYPNTLGYGSDAPSERHP